MLEEDKADKEWWESLAIKFQLGELMSFAQRNCAVFVKDDVTYHLHDPLLSILLKLEKKFDEMDNES